MPADGTNPQYDQGTTAVLALGERIRGLFGSGPAAPADPGIDEPMTDAERRDWIKGVGPRERIWGFLLAGYAAVVALVVGLPGVVEHAKVRVTGQVCGHHHFCYTTSNDLLFMIIALALAAGVAAAAYFRRRSILTFALLLSALAASILTLGLPLLIGGGWLFLRSWRVQRYGTPNGKVAGARAAEMRKSGEKPRGFFSLFNRGGGTSSPASSRTTTKTTRTATAGRRDTPEQNKRYTPKKAKPAESKNRYESTKVGNKSTKSAKAPKTAKTKSRS